MRFALLGVLDVVDDAGARVTVAGERARVLLAMLLLQAGTPVPQDLLVETAWAGKLVPEPATVLRSAVRRLRASLGPGVAARIIVRPPGYLIEVYEGELDVAVFEHRCRESAEARRGANWQQASDAADAALALWRGTPLLDVPAPELQGRYVPHLGQLHLQALETRAEADLRLGRHEQAIAALRDLIAGHPLREPLHAQLMTALALCGRRAEAFEAYQHARRTLRDELGVEPGSELRAVQHRILSAGSDAALTSPGEAGVFVEGGSPQRPDTAAVPRQLPAAPRHFTGRDAELDRLAALAGEADARGGTVVISAIDGMAGIGKTALAVHAAHRLAEQFPDGQLFLDLHGYTQGHPPRTAGEALAWLLQALGVPPQRIPGDGEQAAALYRQHLAGTTTLIVLDNAATEAQVRPLLPGSSSCLVLVTSRRRLKGLDDARIMSLDLLAPPDAVALLRAVAGPGRISADDPLLSEVAGFCGYLPLALRIAGALLRHRSAWTLEHLAAQLRDQHHRVTALSDGERELADVFDLSYMSMDTSHRALFRRLGLIPGPDLDAHATAALLEVDPAAAAGLLENLVDHNLITLYAPGRYRLHDLLRAHARVLADTDPASERVAAEERLLHYYAHTAQSASLSIAHHPRLAPDGPAPAHAPALWDPQAARSWLRTEQPNLDAAFNHARTHGLDRYATALAAGLAEILQADGPWTRAAEIHQAAAEIADHQCDRATQATALTYLGRVLRLTGDYPGADTPLARALGIRREIGDLLGEANTVAELGRVRHAIGDTAAAGDSYARALQIYREIGNRLGEANTLAELGRVRYTSGDFAGAGNAAARAAQVYREIGHRLGQANTLIDLGRVRYMTGDCTGAKDAVTQALEGFCALGSRLGQANALVELARVQHATGDYPEADDAVTHALRIYREIGNRLGEAFALQELGRVRRATGDYPGAGNALTQALEIYQALGCRGEEAAALNEYAATLAAAGRRTRALTLYQQALSVHRDLDKPDDEAVSLEGIAEHHLATGDPAQGAAHLHQALEIYHRLGMNPDAERVQARLAALAPE